MDISVRAVPPSLFQKVVFCHSIKVPDLFKKYFQSKILEAGAHLSSSMLRKYREEARVATVTMIDFVGIEDWPADCNQWIENSLRTVKPLKLLKVEQSSNVSNFKYFEMQDTFLISSTLLNNTMFKPCVVHRL